MTVSARDGYQIRGWGMRETYEKNLAPREKCCFEATKCGICHVELGPVEKSERWVCTNQSCPTKDASADKCVVWCGACEKATKHDKKHTRLKLGKVNADEGVMMWNWELEAYQDGLQQREFDVLDAKTCGECKTAFTGKDREQRFMCLELACKGMPLCVPCSTAHGEGKHKTKEVDTTTMTAPDGARVALLRAHQYTAALGEKVKAKQGQKECDGCKTDVLDKRHFMCTQPGCNDTVLCEACHKKHPQDHTRYSLWLEKSLKKP